MDWAKAKNLLIFLFLTLNIFLAVYLFMSFHNDSSKKNILNTEKILMDRGYGLNAKIPNISEASVLLYDKGELDKTFTASKLLNKPLLSNKDTDSSPILNNGNKTITFTSKSSFTFKDETPTKAIDISSKDKVEKYTRQLLRELKLPISNLYVDSYKINPDKSISITFIEQYKKVFIFNNSFHFNISQKGLTLLECNLVKVKGFVNNSKTSIVPAYQILLKYYVDGKNRIIENIDLGYRIKVGGNGSKTPEWRVKMEDGTTEFFDNQGQRIN